MLDIASSQASLKREKLFELFKSYMAYPEHCSRSLASVYNRYCKIIKNNFEYISHVKNLNSKSSHCLFQDAYLRSQADALAKEQSDQEKILKRNFKLAHQQLKRVKQAEKDRRVFKKKYHYKKTKEDVSFLSSSSSSRSDKDFVFYKTKKHGYLCSKSTSFKKA